MREIKLVRLFKTLNSSELRRFKSFVASPYFNKNPKLVRLVSYLSDFHPRFDASELTEENAHQQVLGQEPFKAGAITKLSSKLFKLLVRFFTVEETGHSAFREDFNLLSEYRKRGLLTDFDRLAQNMRKRHQSGQDLKPEVFHRRFLLEREINRVASTKKDKGVGDVNFGMASSALDTYYIYHKLIYTCQKINRGNVIKGFDADDPLSNVLEVMPASGYGAEPIIQIWHEAYLLLCSEDKLPHYNSLKNKMKADVTMPDGAQLRILFTYLENTAIRIIRPRKALYEELFELYEYQRNIGVFLHKDVAVSDVMANYIAVATNLGKIGQARAFLQIADKRLDLKHREMYKLCDSMVLFEEGKYGETLDRLNELHLHNIMMKLGEKRLRLKVYHQLAYEELLYDNINSFRVFLTNNKDNISDRLLESNRRFVTHLRRIAQLDMLSSAEQKELAQEIEEDTKTTEKHWLMKLMVT